MPIVAANRLWKEGSRSHFSSVVPIIILSYRSNLVNSPNSVRSCSTGLLLWKQKFVSNVLKNWWIIPRFFRDTFVNKENFEFEKVEVESNGWRKIRIFFSKEDLELFFFTTFSQWFKKKKKNNKLEKSNYVNVDSNVPFHVLSTYGTKKSTIYTYIYICMYISRIYIYMCEAVKKFSRGWID